MTIEGGRRNTLDSVTNFVRRSLRRGSRRKSATPKSGQEESYKPLMPAKNFEIVYDRKSIPEVTSKRSCTNSLSYVFYILLEMLMNWRSEGPIERLLSVSLVCLSVCLYTTAINQSNNFFNFGLASFLGEPIVIAVLMWSMDLYVCLWISQTGVIQFFALKLGHHKCTEETAPDFWRKVKKCKNVHLRDFTICLRCLSDANFVLKEGSLAKWFSDAPITNRFFKYKKDIRDHSISA